MASNGIKLNKSKLVLKGTNFNFKNSKIEAQTISTVPKEREINESNQNFIIIKASTDNF